jgi:hypothetical protein
VFASAFGAVTTAAAQIRLTTGELKMSNNRIVRGLLVALVALAVTGIAFAQHDEDEDNNNHGPALVKFKGGIGVINLTGVNADGTIKLNVVRGVNPGAPWRIANLNAVVSSDGHIKVKGRGLLLANGEGIGTNGRASVHATLFCGPADKTASAFDSGAVALEADGDFTIDDFLTGGTLPSTCDNPALLIRVGQPGGGVWFAAGIQRQEDEDRD